MTTESTKKKLHFWKQQLRYLADSWMILEWHMININLTEKIWQITVLTIAMLTSWCLFAVILLNCFIFWCGFVGWTGFIFTWVLHLKTSLWYLFICHLPWVTISDRVNNRLEEAFSVKIRLVENPPFWHTVVAWHWFTATFCSHAFWREGYEYFDIFSALFFLIDSSSSFCFVPASVTTRITPLSGMLSRATSTPGKSVYKYSRHLTLKCLLL